MRQFTGPTRPASITSYAMVIAGCIVCYFVTLHFWPAPEKITDQAPPLVLSGTFVLACAWFLGEGPGFLSIFITALLFALAFYPADNLLVARPTDLFRLFMFVGTKSVFCLMAGARTRAEQRPVFLSK